MRRTALAFLLVAYATSAGTQSDQCVCLAPTLKPGESKLRDTHGTLASYNDWYRDPVPDKLHKARGRYITTAAEQLARHGLSNIDAQYLYEEARYAPANEERFAKLSDRITVAAKQRGVLCEVTFSTRHTGAVINYQTVGERLRNETAHTLPATTNCVTKLPIGAYFIWASRDSKATSDINREIPIINDTESVQLQERK